jgi:hypothetical protein
MLRDVAAMNSNLLGEKMIATSRTRNGTRRVVGRRDGRIMKMGGRWMKERVKARLERCILFSRFAEWDDRG